MVKETAKAKAMSTAKSKAKGEAKDPAKAAKAGKAPELALDAPKPPEDAGAPSSSGDASGGRGAGSGRGGRAGRVRGGGGRGKKATAMFDATLTALLIFLSRGLMMLCLVCCVGVWSDIHRLCRFSCVCSKFACVIYQFSHAPKIQKAAKP